MSIINDQEPASLYCNLLEETNPFSLVQYPAKSYLTFNPLFGQDSSSIKTMTNHSGMWDERDVTS